jgi:hypothetical protein
MVKLGLLFVLIVGRVTGREIVSDAWWLQSQSSGVKKWLGFMAGDYVVS